jgi:Kef-type K+ transport system membrane component KefB
MIGILGEKMTNEEKKANSEALDASIKHVFDNLRNVIICATIALAGGAVIKYRLELPLGAKFNLIIGILVIVAAFVLFTWNMIHGVEKLIRPVKKTKKSWLLIPFAIVYMFSIFAVFQSTIIDQSQQLKPSSRSINES